MWRGRWRCSGLGAGLAPAAAFSPVLVVVLLLILLFAMGEGRTFCANVPVRLRVISVLSDPLLFQTTRQPGRHAEWPCVVGAECCLLSRRHSLRFQVCMILSSFLNAKVKIVFYELP